MPTENSLVILLLFNLKTVFLSTSKVSFRSFFNNVKGRLLFIFSINGNINTSYIIPIAMGLGAVIITILQTIMFARRYTKYDTLDYLNDLFYICKWYVSYKDRNKPKQEQPQN